MIKGGAINAVQIGGTEKKSILLNEKKMQKKCNRDKRGAINAVHVGKEVRHPCILPLITVQPSLYLIILRPRHGFQPCLNLGIGWRLFKSAPPVYMIQLARGMVHELSCKKGFFLK